MNHASLFTGFGGFDFASDAMGWQTVLQVEKNPFCKTLLKYYWPNAVLKDDIKTTDFRPWRGAIDILTGGFPCQPYSVAGARKGKADDRHLWPEMLRAIREIEPPIIVGENVPGFISWNKGLVFQEAQAEMEAEGYEVQTYVLPAIGIDAPHIRSRVFIVAYSDSRWRRRIPKPSKESRPCQSNQQTDRLHGVLSTANADGKRGLQGKQKRSPRQPNQTHQKWSFAANADGSRQSEQHTASFTDRQTYAARLLSEPWHHWPSQSPVCSRDDVFPHGLDGITFSKWRNESISGFGNAVPPALVYKIFKAIDQFINLKSDRA